MGNRRKKPKLPAAPQLPAHTREEDIEVSDEDLQFVKSNIDYAGFVSRLDTDSITRYVTRAADDNLENDNLEKSHEKRLRNRSQNKPVERNGIEVDPVDALPVKSFDGQLYYRRSAKSAERSRNEQDEIQDGENATNSGMEKSNLEGKSAKGKKKKDAKQPRKSTVEMEQLPQIPQAEVLASVKEELTAEEAFENKKSRLAELGLALVSDPESNIRSLREIIQLCNGDDISLTKLALLSLLAVFKSIIPGYRIRLPTEKEKEIKVSKDVKKIQTYESSLLSFYKGYLHKLITMERKAKYHHTAVHCICTLLEAFPHFNFRDTLLFSVVKNIGSQDDITRKLCCDTIKSLFTNEGKHGGEVTLDAVRLIADHVKANISIWHPDSVQVFLSLSFDKDVRKHEENKGRKKKEKRKREKDETFLHGRNQSQKHELMMKIKDEVDADYKAITSMPDPAKQRKMQSDTLLAMFETYFRILKHASQLLLLSPEETDHGVADNRHDTCPLLMPCLEGLAKFCHLIDMDYIGDVMNNLKRLAGADKLVNRLALSDRLQCCIVAFKVMRTHLDALNVDLHDFFIQLYNLLLEYRPGRDRGEVLSEALKIMLCDDRQHDMQKSAAFIKRLATFSLSVGSAESMAALVTVKNLLQKNTKCRNLIENDAGGGSVSGPSTKYQSDAVDPNLSGAFASVLWELNLLVKHYHPTISSMSSSIANMGTSHTHAPKSINPLQAYADLSIKSEPFNLKPEIKSTVKKRPQQRPLDQVYNQDSSSFDEGTLFHKFSQHFGTLLKDVKENRRLRRESPRNRHALEI